MSERITVPANLVALTHTGISTGAFLVALGACWLSGHWADVCYNDVSDWPVEWFPSVSAVIGDYAAMRSPFQILIALCAGPRFVLLAVLWIANSQHPLANVQLIAGLFRTFVCAGWMFVTSRDHHDLHDICMIVYLALDLVWMVVSTIISPRRQRLLISSMFSITIPPLVFLYLRHAMLRIPGAYTHYAFLEWSLVVWDIAFDSAFAQNLADIQFAISGPARPVKEDRPLLPHMSPFRATIALASDIYLATCFWSVFTALNVQLFYWSVWKLALAGPELALLANLSPFLANILPSFSHSSLKLHHMIMILAGLGAYAFPTPAGRLVALSLATFCGWLAMVPTWTKQPRVLIIALGLCMLLKLVNHSNNPLWCMTRSMGNHIGLGLGILALAEYLMRPETADGQFNRNINTKFDVTFATGLGSLIHLTQTFLSDSGTILAWTWSGYPISGPTLQPFSCMVIAALCLGSLVQIGVAGPVGALLLYRYPDWLGFVGGLLVTAYLAGLLPLYLHAAMAEPIAKTFGFALLVNCMLDVLSVATTAYAFVPYGWLLRERTDLILLFAFGTVELGRWHLAATPFPHKRLLALSGAITLLSCVASCKPATAPQPYSQLRLFTAGIWTVHFGIDEGGLDSQWRMMELVRDMEVDVLGLLETDLHRFVYGNRDLTRVISEELGYYVDLGPGPNKHTWGAALLSKFPIINSTHHLLPSPHGELAPAIHATIDVHGEMVNVLVSHNGQEEDALDRELQTTEIARLLRTTADTPTVFLGYLVTHPGDKRPWPYQILMEDGKMLDIEVQDLWRWCEYIAFRGLWRIAFARVHESDISDTELQVGRFLLPQPGQKAQYASDTELYWHIGEGDVPEPWRLPGMFWGNGTRGHRYTVWRGPLYYLPPLHSGLQRYGAPT